MSAPRPTKRPIFKHEIQQSLEEKFREKNLDKRYLEGVLQNGYCSDRPVLTAFRDWYHDVYPSLAAAVSDKSSSPIKWVNEINQGVVAIQLKDSTSQAELSQKAVQFLQAYPVSHKDLVINSFKKGGLCDGYSFFVMHFVATELQRQLATNPDVDVCWENTWKKLEEIFDGLRKFQNTDTDGSKEEKLDDARVKAIQNMLEQVSAVQHCYSQLSHASSDWHHLSVEFVGAQFAQIDSVLEEFEEAKVRPIIENFIAYKHEFAVIESEERKETEAKKPASTEPNAKAVTVEALRLGANAHASVILKITIKGKAKPIIVYFEPNAFRLVPPEKLNTPALLAKAFCVAHEQKDGDFELLRAPGLPH